MFIDAGFDPEKDKELTVFKNTDSAAKAEARIAELGAWRQQVVDADAHYRQQLNFVNSIDFTKGLKEVCSYIKQAGSDLLSGALAKMRALVETITNLTSSQSQAQGLPRSQSMSDVGAASAESDPGLVRARSWTAERSPAKFERPTQAPLAASELPSAAQAEASTSAQQEYKTPTMGSTA